MYSSPIRMSLNADVQHNSSRETEGTQLSNFEKLCQKRDADLEALKQRAIEQLEADVGRRMRELGIAYGKDSRALAEQSQQH